MRLGSLSVRYLGIPLVDTNLRHIHFSKLIEQVKDHLASLKYKLLSFVGRIKLIRVVLFSFLNYWIAAFSFPTKTKSTISSIMSRFLWQRGIHTINWTSISHPKEEGGLGIRSINTLCKASTAKRVWTLLTSSCSLWAKWMKQKYLKGIANFWSVHSAQGDSGVWKEMLNHRDVILPHIRHLVGTGSSISFWEDPWLLEGHLIDRLGWTNMMQVGHIKASVSDFFTGASSDSLPPQTLKCCRCGGWSNRLISLAWALATRLFGPQLWIGNSPLNLRSTDFM